MHLVPVGNRFDNRPVTITIPPPHHNITPWTCTDTSVLLCLVIDWYGALLGRFHQTFRASECRSSLVHPMLHWPIDAFSSGRQFDGLYVGVVGLVNFSLIGVCYGDSRKFWWLVFNPFWLLWENNWDVLINCWYIIIITRKLYEKVFFMFTRNLNIFSWWVWILRIVSKIISCITYYNI